MRTSGCTRSSRRNWPKTASSARCARRFRGAPAPRAEDGVMREITIACCTSDRTAELARQRISLDGTPYRMISIDPGSEIFYRMFEYEEFDVAEMSLSTYATAVGQGDR